MAASAAGYYRQPTIHDDVVVFVSEDDLWSVPAGGGEARRLTSNPGRVSAPALSPDGIHLAFTGRDEGQPEVYVMPAAGGEAERVTFLGAETRVVGWTAEPQAVVFASSHGAAFPRVLNLFTVNPADGAVGSLDLGPAMSISYGPGGGAVLGRHTTDLARWKRYRGGLTGELWVDPTGGGDWRRLIDLDGNVALPLWVGDRIYFLSDHRGIGNLYSVLPDGTDLQTHTHHTNFYARHAATDGRRIVYSAGADLHLFDPSSGQTGPIAVGYPSPRAERRRKFVSASGYLQSYDLHPKGHSVAITSRGKAFTMAHWAGAVRQHGEESGVRYRLAAWLWEGDKMVVVSDAGGEEALEVHTVDGSQAPVRLDGLDIGRPVGIWASPTSDEVAIANHRNELVAVDIGSREARVLDKSRHSRLHGVAWSPDGRWIAYGFAVTRQTSAIKLCEVATGETHTVTRPVLHDGRPSFDPEGKFLYFLSYRDFNPVYDNLHFDLNFPWGMRPHLVALRADAADPFELRPEAPGAGGDAKGDGNGKDGGGSDDKATDADEEASPDPAQGGDDAGAKGDDEAKGDGKDDKDHVSPPRLVIDLEGIADRVAAFPVSDGRYGQIVGLKGKVLFTKYYLQGALDAPWRPAGPPPARGHLVAYDFSKQDTEEIVSGVTSFVVSFDGKTLMYRSGNRLRALKAGAKPGDKSETAGPKSGWLSLGRVKVSVDPAAEWRQMLREAWRLQRDQFWVPDMSGVDWEQVYDRYAPLVDRVATRSELSDLLWEMQGELGTSHAYEFGGDYRPEPAYHQGLLAADLRYDPEAAAYEIVRIVAGDPWRKGAGSPLARVGSAAAVGEHIVAVNGRAVGAGRPPAHYLVNQAGEKVDLTLRAADGKERIVTVKTLTSEVRARYREWVEANRRFVEDATGGRVGYIHVPDMSAAGYAEFHRGFLPQVDCEGLIIDVRYNGGGHVSQLLLEKLARRRIGYDIQRWGEPVPYPYEAVMGPLVAVTNEAAGSDGDMFSHAFKLMGLGPLVGKRTWGGVIGISVRDSLVDGGVTTQPEFSFWFEDVGYGLENHGAEPDIEVDIRPQDYAAGRDTQLQKAVEVIQELLAENPPNVPDFGRHPSRALPAAPEGDATP